jgi:DNA polymerase III epsilon subunit-like protein
MILAFDTETTGKAFFKLPVSHPDQPRIIQLGAILYDLDWNVRAEVNLIAKGIPIPEEAAKVHGITTEIAQKCGVPPSTLLSAFVELSEHATVVVAHNFQFDRFMLAIEAARQMDVIGKFDHLVDISFCTMLAMTDICKIPGPYGNKWPRLQEAHQYALGKPFEGAHDAMADVRACAAIYRWLKTREQTDEIEKTD